MFIGYVSLLLSRSRVDKGKKEYYDKTKKKWLLKRETQKLVIGEFNVLE